MRPHRVVAVSIRGAAHADLARRAAELGDGSALSRLVAGGSLARLRPLPNAETFPAMATFETGAWPAQHGVVGNTYHVAGDPLSRTTRAYSDAIFTSETLWEAAARQGKKVIRLGTLFPRGSRTDVDTDSVRSLPQAEQLGSGRVTVLEPEAAAVTPGSRRGVTGPVALAPAADAPALAIEGAAGEPFVLALHAFAVAGSGEETASASGGAGFDRVLLDDDRDPGNGVRAELASGDWAQIVVRPGSRAEPATIGTWVKLLALDPESGASRLYLRPPHRNRSTPAEFAATLEEQLGFAPGAPDYQSFARGLIDADTVLEEIEREVTYVINAALHVLDHLDFDLLLIDDPALDRVGHPFHIVDPRQEGFGDGAPETTEDRWRRGYRLADAGLHSILSRLESPADEDGATALVVTSEYGFFAAHTRLAINRLLADAGFAVAGDQAEVRAFASTASAHLRIQPTAVAASEFEDRVQHLAKVLRDFRDPESGQEIFDLIVPRSELAQVHLDHPLHAGDLWVRLRPGYTFHGSVDPERPLFDTPRFAGDHGYAPESDEAQGFFLVAGVDGLEIETTDVEAVDVAVTVAGLLGIEPPSGSRGKNRLE